MSELPHFAEGEVVKGFGRGSRELGIPTANFTEEVVDRLPAAVRAGVYVGFASVAGGPVHKMAMNVGWNPFYNNTKKSMETYVLHKFEEDFYGKWLRIVMVEFVRPEKNFNSVAELIDEIRNDVRIAEERLEDRKYDEFKNHEFFKQS